MKNFIKLTTVDNEKIGLCVDDITFLKERYVSAESTMFCYTKVYMLNDKYRFVKETVEQIVDSINKIKG